METRLVQAHRQRVCFSVPVHDRSQRHESKKHTLITTWNRVIVRWWSAQGWKSNCWCWMKITCTMCCSCSLCWAPILVRLKNDPSVINIESHSYCVNISDTKSKVKLVGKKMLQDFFLLSNNTSSPHFLFVCKVAASQKTYLVSVWIQFGSVSLHVIPDRLHNNEIRALEGPDHLLQDSLFLFKLKMVLEWLYVWDWPEALKDGSEAITILWSFGRASECDLELNEQNKLTEIHHK